MDMYKISLQRIRSRGFHGTLDHEKEHGNDFITDVDIYIPYEPVSRIEDTIDYAIVAEWVQMELAIPTELLESLADRIVERILSNYNHIEKIRVRIRKKNPDVSLDVDFSAVELIRTRP